MLHTGINCLRNSPYNDEEKLAFLLSQLKQSGTNTLWEKSIFLLAYYNDEAIETGRIWFKDPAFFMEKGGRKHDGQCCFNLVECGDISR